MNPNVRIKPLGARPGKTDWSPPWSACFASLGVHGQSTPPLLSWAGVRTAHCHV